MKTLKAKKALLIFCALIKSPVRSFSTKIHHKNSQSSGKAWSESTSDSEDSFTVSEKQTANWFLI